MPTKQELKDRACAAIEERKDEIIALAKDILKNPETGYTEMRTSGLVKEWFKRLDIPYRDEIALTGVKGQLQGGVGAGPAVGLVAEMDGIKIADGNDRAPPLGRHIAPMPIDAHRRARSYCRTVRG